MNYLEEIFEISNKSKYTKWYVSLCKRGQIRKLDDYTEKHHIVPKFAKGSNSRKNITNLTGREHFIAHLLLTKMFDDLNLCIRAKAGLGGFVSQNRNDKRKLSSRQIGLARKAKSESQRGKKFTEEHREKIRLSLIGKKKSKEHVEANRTSHLGKTLSKESIEKRTLTAKRNREMLKKTDPALYQQKRIQKIERTSKGKVVIDGIEYPSIKEASRSISRNPDYIRHRVFSDNYPTWVFVPRVV